MDEQVICMDISVITVYINYMKPSQLNIFMRPEVMELLDHFTSLFKVRIAFFSPDKKELHAGRGWPCSRYCMLLRKKLELHSHCIACDQANFKEASQQKRLVSYTCHAGLLEAIMPVFVRGELAGFLMIGQIRKTARVSTKIAAAWKKKVGKDLGPLLKSYQLLPLSSCGQFKSLLQLFSVLVEYIVLKNMVEIERSIIIEKIKEYVESHLDVPIKLDAIALVVAKSPTTITHLFKKETGAGLKAWILQRKMEKAAEYLTFDRSQPIKAIAAMVGFNDPFHFSRAFCRIKGISPGKYRERYDMSVACSG